MDSGNVSAIISAVAGLAGVLTGALATYLKERRAERIKDEKDSSYLAILVVSHLDRFANGCLNVAYDEGTEYGQPAGGDGRYQTTVEPPQFVPLEIAVEWKVLPRDLMYEILQIPEKQAHIQNRLAGIAEHEDPYDGSDYFWARQRDYAELCLHVSTITKKLRKHTGMPIEQRKPGDWSREIAVHEIIEKIDTKRAASEMRVTDAKTGSKLVGS